MTDGQMVDSVKKEKKSNAWIEHVRDFRKKHPELSYKQCLVQAKETYVKKA